MGGAKAMGQELHSIRDKHEHTVEIVVHVAESLVEGQRNDLVAALENDDGIVSAEFCPLRYHLMLVRYDRERYSSQDVLRNVRSRKIDARLIGPV
jgi:phosphoribosyl-ATP pyrophosphohydrolase